MLMPFVAVSCASSPKLPPRSAGYVQKEEAAMRPSVNSLWTDGASLYEDNKARRLNDLLTIKVVENIKGSGTADTSTGRDSSITTGMDSIFGLSPQITGFDLLGKGKTFSPEVSGSMKDSFKGTGETARQGKLVGTITAKVVDVMPNGNLMIESRKEITINREKQILVLTGMVRPSDIGIDNVVSSDKVADAEVFFVGDGVVGDKQGQGWLIRILDKIWPF